MKYPKNKNKKRILVISSAIFITIIYIVSLQAAASIVGLNHPDSLAERQEGIQQNIQAHLLPTQ